MTFLSILICLACFLGSFLLPSSLPAFLASLLPCHYFVIVAKLLNSFFFFFPRTNLMGWSQQMPCNPEFEICLLLELYLSIEKARFLQRSFAERCLSELLLAATCMQDKKSSVVGICSSFIQTVMIKCLLDTLGWLRQKPQTHSHATRQIQNSFWKDNT